MSADKVQSLVNVCPHCGGKLLIRSEQVQGDNKVLLIKEDKKFFRVDIKDIQVIEAMRDYLKILTTERCIITHMTLSKMETLLEDKNFIRVSRSYIINKSAINNIAINSIQLINNLVVPVGMNYREAIRKLTETGIL